MKRSDKDTTLQELQDLVAKFRDERDWAKHHTPKNLAISIAIEAAELMELFQWDKWVDYDDKLKTKVATELADTMIYCLNLADTLGVDLSEAVRAKLATNAKKYPAHLFKKKLGKDDYHRLKQAARESRKSS